MQQIRAIPAVRGQSHDVIEFLLRSSHNRLESYVARFAQELRLQTCAVETAHGPAGPERRLIQCCFPREEPTYGQPDLAQI